MGKSEELDVDIKSVSFTYPPPHRIEALKNVNIQISRGEFVALIGQNGSGKTTLARCVSGFLRPNKGSVFVTGDNIHEIAPNRQAQYVGYVFQNPDHQLFRDSVWEDVAFGPSNLNLPADTIEDRVNKLLTDLDLIQYSELHPQRLPTGDRQRLAVAAIAIMEAPVIIVDEPTTGQDPQRAREVMEVLTRLNREKNTTVLVITHAMELVAEYASRAIALCQGEVLLDLPVREAFSRPDVLRQTFVEPPPVVQMGLQLGLSPVPLTVAEAKQRIMESLRP